MKIDGYELFITAAEDEIIVVDKNMITIKDRQYNEITIKLSDENLSKLYNELISFFNDK